MWRRVNIDIASRLVVALGALDSLHIRLGNNGRGRGQRLVWLWNSTEKVVVRPPHTAVAFRELRACRVGRLATSAIFLLLLRQNRDRGDGLVFVPAGARVSGKKLAAKLLRAGVNVGKDLLLLLVGDTVVVRWSVKGFGRWVNKRQHTTYGTAPHRLLAGRCRWWEKAQCNWLPRLDRHEPRDRSELTRTKGRVKRGGAWSRVRKKKVWW